MSVVIHEKASGTTLAKGEPEVDVVKYEGNWYFTPEVVERSVLVVTDRTYTCPYKGTCHWVDFSGPGGEAVKDVAWVYADPKPGHEIIKDRYGFYAGSRGATTQD
ncbi:MAG: hypothetical protein JWN86_2016 [Planctomycetota bacterium]|nr:hypothetical protein [Planctomycetota bacterium]